MDAAISDQNTRLHALTVKYDVMADTPDKPLGYEIITKIAECPRHPNHR